MQKLNSIIIYKSFIDSVEQLDDVKIKYECYMAIFNYGFYGAEPSLDSDVNVRVFFKLIKPLIDGAHDRYAKCVENGKRGGAPLGNQNARKKIEI